MKSQTLTFEIEHEGKTFQVAFDTDSEERNRLMNIDLDGYPLDTVEIQINHRKLYGAIKSQMDKESRSFWNRGQRQTFDKMPDLVMLSNNFFNQFKN